MVKIVAALIGGVLLGSLAMFAADRFGTSGGEASGEIVRDIASVPQFTQAAADHHRDEHYASLSSVEDVIGLPTGFARSEALYVLAGRTNSAGVQYLMLEANRIADDMERGRLLNILFFRLAETDPRSALALARSDNFKEMQSIERTVWRAWARMDLDDALQAAKVQDSSAHRIAAVQSLYAAFGNMGNETTDRIETELGMGPNRRTRSRYLYRLADHSPEKAITFINNLEPGPKQSEYVSWLAYYLSSKDPSTVIQYAVLFALADLREHFSNIVNRNAAREDPKLAIERLLAGSRAQRSTGKFQSAIRALVKTDLEAAMLHFDQAGSSNDRRMIGSEIVSQMAKDDPAGAVLWAREHEDNRFPYLQMAALGIIARTNPQLALTEALKTPNIPMRSSVISNVVQQIGRGSLADAVTYLDQIQDKKIKLEASQHLASRWIRDDPESALDWILGQDDETTGQLMQMSVSRLLQNDIDLVIRVLPRIDEGRRHGVRRRIAERLAIDRSADEAQGFIRQFEGEPGYAELQAAFIVGVAHTDALTAKRLADQLLVGDTRDRAYMQVVAQRAQTHPIEAIRWLSGISDESLRGAATGQIAVQWYGHDPVEASRWVVNLPTGSSRDDAIVQLSSRWGDPTAEQQAIIASIENRDKRGQAKIRRIYHVLRTNPTKARELLDDEDIPGYQRQQLELRISQYSSAF